MTSYVPEEDRWSSYVRRMIQTAYPNYQLIGDKFLHEQIETFALVRRMYELQLQSAQERMGVQVAVTFSLR